MFSIRRYVTYFVITAAMLLVINRLYTYAPQLQVQQSSSLYKDKGSNAQTAFRWDNVPIYYPIAPQSLLALPTGQPLKLPKIQYEFKPETARQSQERITRQAAVKQAFRKCWDAYQARAWMHDELSPISGEYNDKFGGWGATLVDNLDTLWIMDLKAEFNKAVDAVMKIDTTAIKIETVNVFETNIRHLGGLLSAYDLSGDSRLLEKAQEFGEMLLTPFDTPNHLPIARWLWEPASRGIPQQSPEKILLAEIGSLSMEFTRLSQLTNDPRWYSAVHNLTLSFASELRASALPGMFPVTIGAKEKLDVAYDNFYTLNGMADSFFEYLPKMHLLLGGLEPVYQHLFETTMTVAAKHTLYRPMTPDNADILFSGAVRVKSTGSEFTANVQHLGCFTGGMFTLGGRLFNNPAHFDTGIKLTNGCIWAYNALPLGVMSEEFKMVRCESMETCKWDEALWRQEVRKLMPDDTHLDSYIIDNRLRNGIAHFVDTKYHLRPEAIESVFLLYRMTGNTTLLDVAWAMYTSIMDITTTSLANAAMLDVTFTHEELKQVKSQQFDSMESFWLAETLKYFYLIFSRPELISLDEYVFNTEAHPFRRPKA